MAQEEIKKFTRNNCIHEYIEELDENDKNGDHYCYGVFCKIGKQEVEIVITTFGVSLFYPDGSAKNTNLQPYKMFPECNKLTVKQLIKVMDILEATGFEGKMYSKEHMEEVFQEWEKENKSS